jgi:hypothetical protein
MSRAVWLLAFVALLAGCDEAVKPVPVPQVVRVEVPVYMPIPAELTQDCPIAEAASLQVEEAVRVANARKVSLQNCNADKAALRALGASASPQP